MKSLTIVDRPGQRRTSIVQNKFLATLPPPEFEHLRPFLLAMDLKRYAVIHEADRPVDWVYFIESGAVALVAGTKVDAPIEVAIVGRFGFVGLSVVLGNRIAAHRSVVEIPGRALRIAANDLQAEMSENPSIRNHLLNYVHLLISQQAQIALCNAKHEVGQRLARWLLLACDRVVGNPIPITHSQLAAMLGVWRPNVTDALAALEEEGILSKGRGAVRIIDRDLLKARACECYKLIDNKFAWYRAAKDYEHRLDRDLGGPG